MGTLFRYWWLHRLLQFGPCHNEFALPALECGNAAGDILTCIAAGTRERLHSDWCFRLACGQQRDHAETNHTEEKPPAETFKPAPILLPGEVLVEGAADRADNQRQTQ